MKKAGYIFGRIKRRKHSREQVSYDHCVCCGKTTKYPLDQQIVARKYYIQGCGQCCKACFMKLGMTVTEDPLSNDDLKRLLNICAQDEVTGYRDI